MNFGSDLRNAHSFLDAPASDTAQHSSIQAASSGQTRYMHAVKLSRLVCWMLPSTRRGMSVPHKSHMFRRTV
jgi:hypothetical protein